MPFFSRDSRFNMVVNAIIGAYGLTYITISGVSLGLYILIQLGLI